MTEFGEVVSVAEGNVTVRFERTSACGKCGACGMKEDQKEILLTFQADGYTVGEKVSVEMPDGGMAVSVLILYVVPLAALFVGLLVGLAVFSGESRELFSALLGLGATALSYTVIKLCDCRLRKKKLFQPRLVKQGEK